MTPPGWNGWLHQTVDTPPTDEDYRPREWELPHHGNPTGTPGALRPKGSIVHRGHRQASAATIRPGRRAAERAFISPGFAGNRQPRDARGH